MAEIELQASSGFFNSRLNAIRQMKKKNHVQSMDTIAKIVTKTDKEKLILDLRLELNYLQALQYSYQENLDLIHSHRKETEKNHSEINAYCASLRSQLKEFVDKIDWFESKISSLRDEDGQLKRTNESIILLKQNEQIQLETEHKKILEKINEQLFKIKCMKEDYQTQDKRRKNEKKELSEREAKDIQQYNILFKQQRDMLNQFNIYEQDDDASDLVELKTQRKIYRENIQKEELIIKLDEEKLKEEMLTKEFEAMNEKVQRLSIQAIEEVKNRFSSLKHGSHTKNYSNNRSISSSTNRYSTMFHSIKSDLD